MNWLAWMLHWHRFEPWKITGEVPIWRHVNVPRLVALAVQPIVERNMWVIRGKIIEQRRSCRRCGFSQVEFKTLYLGKSYHQ